MDKLTLFVALDNLKTELAFKLRNVNDKHEVPELYKCALRVFEDVVEHN